MACGPPSYPATLYRQLWPIVAPYVQIYDLSSGCLVCRQWNAILTPLLWGNPASLFGTDSDTIYLSLTRFKRRLCGVRLEIRSLVHTLDIPPAQPDLYQGPQAGWFRDILDRLPNLQVLIVSNLSFFDHQSLQSINQTPEQSLKTYPLKLLNASKCENTTPASLSIAITHFPELIYLDLSGAHGARHPRVLQQMGILYELRVLKLASCGLRDEDLNNLSVPAKLRSLDLSNNFISERGISNLIYRLPAIGAPPRSNSINGRRYSGVPLPIRVLDEGIEHFVARRLACGINGFLQIEEGIPQTFTHLYIASNNLTIDGITRLPSHPNLQHLDCGTLNLSQRPFELLSPSSPTRSRSFSDVIPEAEFLSPNLFTHSFVNLRYLRIHHSVVTSLPFSGKEIATSEQCFELPSEDLRYELDSTELAAPGTFYELEDTSSSIRYELPEAEVSAESLVEEPLEYHATFESPDDVGADLTPVSPMSTQGFDDILSRLPQYNPSIHTIPRKQVPSRSFSESTSSSQLPFSNPLTTSTSAPLGPEAYRYRYTQGEERPWRETLPLRRKAITIKQLIEEINQRLHRLRARERQPGRFTPFMLPNLKTLILTDIPFSTRQRNIPNALSMLIQELAEEEELARLEYLRHYQDENTIPDYELNPPPETLKLQQLIFEITSRTSPFFPSQPSSRLSFSKSATEDPDTEMFMHASEADFSFFGEDDGGLLVRDARIDGVRRGDDGLILEGNEGHSLDVVGELVSFRREKRRIFEGRAWEALSGTDRALAGHWRGTVKVVKEVVGN